MTSFTPHQDIALRAVADWLRACPVDAMFTTAISETEILYGARCLPDGQRRSRLVAAARELFETTFAGRVLPFDATAASLCADLRIARERAGDPIKSEDSMIAAIAQAHGATVVTRDRDGTLTVVDASGTATEVTAAQIATATVLGAESDGMVFIAARANSAVNSATFTKSATGDTLGGGFGLVGAGVVDDAHEGLEVEAHLGVADRQSPDEGRHDLLAERGREPTPRRRHQRARRSARP